jgi:hypothetical protein
LEEADRQAQIFAHETVLVDGERRHQHPGMILLRFWSGDESYDRPLYRVRLSVKRARHQPTQP